MHRSLLIQLGGTFAPAIDRVVREYRARRDARALGNVQLAELRAPVEGVGNLSRPITALRERLERDISEALEALLSQSPTSDEELLLDVFVLGNLGEPLVANATMVVVDMLVGIVDAQFRTIFPAHRRGPARRFRVIPILLLPGTRECATDRDAAIAELRALHGAIVERRNIEHGAEFPIDRVFLLDAVTTRGIGAMDDLVEQVRLFLRLLLFAGIRRDVAFATVLESECNDLFAGIGIACCEVDFVALRETLTARMTNETAAALSMSGPCSLPAPSHLLDVRTMDDERVRDAAIAEIDALPARTLDADGLQAVRPLASLYGELAERLENWRTVASTPKDDPTEIANVTQPSSAPLALGSAVVLGAAISALAHFGLLLSIGTSLATGGAFAVIGGIVAYLIARRPTPEPAEQRAANGQREDERLHAIAALEAAVRTRKSQLDGLAERFDGIHATFSLDEFQSEPLAVATTYCEVLTSPELLDLLFQRRVTSDATLAMANEWLRNLGGWEDLLRQNAVPTATELESYCQAHFHDLGGTGLFDDAECRERIRPTLKDFVGRWRSGVPVALEGESLMQHDTDGFRRPLTAAIVAPNGLGVELSTNIRTLDSTAVVQYTRSRLDDVFMVSVLLDVHPDAVAALAHLRQE